MKDYAFNLILLMKKWLFVLHKKYNNKNFYKFVYKWLNYIHLVKNALIFKLN